MLLIVTTLRQSFIIWTWIIRNEGEVGRSCCRRWEAHTRIPVHWSYFDISSGFLTNWLKSEKTCFSSEGSLRRSVNRSMSRDIQKLFAPNQTERVDLSNEPETKDVQPTVWLQHAWLICVLHTHTRTLQWHYTLTYVTKTGEHVKSCDRQANEPMLTIVTIISPNHHKINHFLSLLCISRPTSTPGAPNYPPQKHERTNWNVV